MNNKKAHDILRNYITMLATLPDELIDALFNICKLIKIKKGQQFLMAGDVPQNIGINLNGIFRLYYIDNDGNDFTKGFSTPGKFIISYSALVQNRPSYFSIESIADSDILVFKYSQWKKMIDEDIRWYPFIFKLLENVYIMKELREKSFLLDDAKTRYLNFIQGCPDIINKIKLYHVASFLGITPEALSRIRKEIKLM